MLSMSCTIWPQAVFHCVKHIRNINFFIYLKGYLGSQQTNKHTSHLNLENNINSNNFLEVLIAGVKLTPGVKHVSTFEGNRRVKKWFTSVFLLRLFFDLFIRPRTHFGFEIFSRASVVFCISCCIPSSPCPAEIIQKSKLPILPCWKRNMF